MLSYTTLYYPIHPFSVSADPYSGLRGLLESVPAVKGRGAGHRLERPPAYHRAMLHYNAMISMTSEWSNIERVAAVAVLGRET